MASRNLLAIDLGIRDLHAIEAVAERDGIRVVRVVHAELEHPPEATPESRGEEVRRILKAAGVSVNSATWTLPRERMIIKKLDLPAALPHERPGMVRLAMQHESSVGEEAAIDFVEQGSGDREVWAVAAPAAELAALRALAGAAGIAVDRVAPRTMGTLTLLQTLGNDAAPSADRSGGEPESGVLVGFDLSSRSAELVAADHAGLRATRGTTLSVRLDAAESAGAEDPATDAAVTEARRSWTALRLTQPDLRPRGVVVLGPGKVAAALGQVIGADVPVRHLERHPRVTTGSHALECAWPLAGLLLEEARGGVRVDLANPRKAPDMAARRRMRVYAAAAVVLLAYGVGWTLGKKDRQGLEHQREQLALQESNTRKDYLRIRRDELKAKHLDAWLASQPQWLDTMLHLYGFAPDPSRVLLAGWSGQVEETVVTATRDGVFSLPPAVRVALDIEATDRAMVDSLREALVTKRDWIVRSASSEGKVGRRLPVAVELLLGSPTGTPAVEAAREATP